MILVETNTIYNIKFSKEELDVLLEILDNAVFERDIEKLSIKADKLYGQLQEIL